MPSYFVIMITFLTLDLRRCWGRPCAGFQDTPTTSAQRCSSSASPRSSSCFAPLHLCHRWVGTEQPGKPPLTSLKKESLQSLTSHFADCNCREFFFFLICPTVLSTVRPAKVKYGKSRRNLIGDITPVNLVFVGNN